MKIRITKLYLFLILLTVLILSSLGIKVLEGMNIIEGNSNMDDSAAALTAGGDQDGDGKDNDGNTAADGDEYNPFSTSESNNLSKMMQGDEDDEEITGDYDDTTFVPDVRVNFQNNNPSKSKMSYGTESGISKDAIPPGQEHLYILKSQVVPPVCPKCPSSGGGGGGGGKGGMKGGDCCPKAPPCPRPQRCPEPAFTCKKVPNYSAANVDSVLPGGGEGGGMMGGGGMGGGGMGGGGGGLLGQGEKDKNSGLLNGTGAGAGDGKAIPVLNSFASYS
jgi:hypothetical protein